MPNWCSNSLLITGSKTELKKIAQFAVVKNKDNEDELNCEAIIPTPAELNEENPSGEKEAKNLNKYGVKNWFDFRVQKWGTKWAPIIESIVLDDIDDEDGGKLSLVFNSAWTPPDGIIGKLATMFPKCQFKLYYFEPGSVFAGRIMWEKGEIVNNNWFSSDDPEYEEIGRDIFGMDDMFDQMEEDAKEEIKEEAKKTKLIKQVKKPRKSNKSKEETVEIHAQLRATPEEILNFELNYMQ